MPCFQLVEILVSSILAPLFVQAFVTRFTLRLDIVCCVVLRRLRSSCRDRLLDYLLANTRTSRVLLACWFCKSQPGHLVKGV